MSCFSCLEMHSKSTIYEDMFSFEFFKYHQQVSCLLYDSQFIEFGKRINFEILTRSNFDIFQIMIKMIKNDLRNKIIPTAGFLHNGKKILFIENRLL